MITLTIKEKVVANKLTKFTTTIKVFKSTDIARKFIKPIIIEMDNAEKKGVQPKISIIGVSYELDSERRFLIETGALKTTGGIDGQ